MNCPRCGDSLRPGESCPTCTPLASIERRVKRLRFTTNPSMNWAAFGWSVGMVLGLLGGVVAAVVFGLAFPDPNPLGAMLYFTRPGVRHCQRPGS